MSAESLPELPAAIQDYAQIWSESATQVLGSLQGKPFTAAPHIPGEVEAPDNTQTLSLVFKVAGKIAGDQCFQVRKSDAVRLAQLLMSEPLDPQAEFSGDRSDAFSELFRQFAGVAATACKAKYGGEVRFNLEETKQPEWTVAGKSSWIFAAPEIEPVQWTLLLGADLRKALEDFKTEKKEESQPEPESQSESRATARPPGGGSVEGENAAASSVAEQSLETPANLDLLLDVELKASLRFGQKEMFLRDILELRPGSVVELDKQVQEPAELLVAGRVIAWGDVVIVDGNYGLRITNIAQPRQRLESVETS